MRPEESLANMAANLAKTTGKPLEEWKAIIAASGKVKHGEIMSLLKGDHAVSHGYANQIALHYRDGLQTTAEADPVDAIFSSKPAVRAIYDDLIAKILEFGNDVDVAPKRAYVSVRRTKQFAILQPGAGRLDVGINLKGVTAEGRLEPSGSFNAMVTHRVRVTTPGEIDSTLLGWLRSAYESA